MHQHTAKQPGRLHRHRFSTRVGARNHQHPVILIQIKVKRQHLLLVMRNQEPRVKPLDNAKRMAFSNCRKHRICFNRKAGPGKKGIKLTKQRLIMPQILKLGTQLFGHRLQNALNLPPLADLQILNAVTDLKRFGRLNKDRLPAPRIILDIARYLIFVLHPEPKRQAPVLDGNRILHQPAALLAAPLEPLHLPPNQLTAPAQLTAKQQKRLARRIAHPRLLINNATNRGLKALLKPKSNGKLIQQRVDLAIEEHELAQLHR